MLPNIEPGKNLPVKHFPTNFQAVIFRLWEFVPAKRLAEVLKTDEETIKGLALLENIPNCELKDMAIYGYTLFKGAHNQIRYYMYRDGMPNRKAMDELVESEKRLALLAYEIMLRNSAVGYEAANHYYVTRTSFIEKVINCDYLLRH